MRLYPNATAVQLSLAGSAVTLAGLVAGQAAVVAWGAAVLIGLAIARATTLVSVARIRSAGFEMLWAGTNRSARVIRGGELILEAELRNLDSLATRFVGLRAVASGHLTFHVEPVRGEVPALGTLTVTLHVRSARVGRHGIFGLALEVCGASGLFEVPLTFANPFGVEVIPAPLGDRSPAARGGRGRRDAETVRRGPRPGDAGEIRELRALVAGDSFRRIAWRASARRGQLLVREFEQQDRETVWVLLDASTELWAGLSGDAPLDGLIDDCAALVERHLRRGDRVGVVVLAHRVLRWVSAASGPAQTARLREALECGPATYDQDRSDLDEKDVAWRVLEHARPLDPRAFAEVAPNDLVHLTRCAAALLRRAPFSADIPIDKSSQGRTLRHYLASFGIDSPARPDHPVGLARSDAEISRTLLRLLRERPRPTLVYIAAPAPEQIEPALANALRAARTKGVTVRWVTARFEKSLLPQPSTKERSETRLLRTTLHRRVALARDRGETLLRRHGVRVEPSSRRLTRASLPAAKASPSEPL